MSRSVRDPNYRRVTTLYKCYDCATLTEHPPNQYGASFCGKHSGIVAPVDGHAAGPIPANTTTE